MNVPIGIAIDKSVQLTDRCQRQAKFPAGSKQACPDRGIEGGEGPRTN